MVPWCPQSSSLGSSNWWWPWLRSHKGWVEQGGSFLGGVCCHNAIVVVIGVCSRYGWGWWIGLLPMSYLYVEKIPYMSLKSYLNPKYATKNMFSSMLLSRNFVSLCATSITSVNVIYHWSSEIFCKNAHIALIFFFSTLLTSLSSLYLPFYHPFPLLHHHMCPTSFSVAW